MKFSLAAITTLALLFIISSCAVEPELEGGGIIISPTMLCSPSGPYAPSSFTTSKKLELISSDLNNSPLVICLGDQNSTTATIPSMSLTSGSYIYTTSQNAHNGSALFATWTGVQANITFCFDTSDTGDFKMQSNVDGTTETVSGRFYFSNGSCP